jgi:hypothetical protein
MGRAAKIDTVIGGHLRVHKRALWGKGATTSTTYELVRPAATADQSWHKRMFPSAHSKSLSGTRSTSNGSG